jgi:hypothetical protein
VPPSKPFTVGSLLIGFYLILMKQMKYDWSILEVANDCVDGISDDDLYGSKEYFQGKESQHPLYCYYERFGFREDPRLFKDYKCFGKNPFPSMKLSLDNYTIECLREISFGNEWSLLPSTFCKSKIKKPIKLSNKCGLVE